MGLASGARHSSAVGRLIMSFLSFGKINYQGSRYHSGDLGHVKAGSVDLKANKYSPRAMPLSVASSSGRVSAPVKYVLIASHSVIVVRTL